MKSIDDWPTLYLQRDTVGMGRRVYIATECVSDIPCAGAVAIYKPIQLMRLTKDGLKGFPVRNKPAKRKRGGAATERKPAK
jgi:hypothetical protein